MAKAATKPKKAISMEEALWKSADKLRGSVEPAEYKHVVLSLFFLEPSRQKWTQKSCKKRNESQYFFCFRKTAAFIPRFT